jgi:hypothetical protein
VAEERRRVSEEGVVATTYSEEKEPTVSPGVLHGIAPREALA